MGRKENTKSTSAGTVASRKKSELEKSKVRSIPVPSKGSIVSQPSSPSLSDGFKESSDLPKSPRVLEVVAVIKKLKSLP